MAVCFSPFDVKAQTEETPAVQTESERWQELTRLLDAAPSPTSVTATFTQERTSLLLDEPVVSAGRFVAKGQTVRLSLVTPEPIEMRFDDASMQIYFPADNVIEHYRIPREGIAYATGRPDPDRLAQDFTMLELRRDESGHRLTIVLEPQDALREHLRSLTMEFDQRRGLIVGTSMVDAAGDRTDMALSEIQTDLEIVDAELNLSVPQDAVHVYPEGAPSPTGAP